MVARLTAAAPFPRATPPITDDERWEEELEAEEAGTRGARQSIDPRAVLAAIRRNRLGIAAILVVALLIGVASILLTPRLYQARASVQVDVQEAKVLGTEDATPQLSGSEADRFLQTQVELLTSRALAQKVSDRLALAANDRFFRRMGETPPDDRALTQEAVLDLLQDNLLISPPRSSNVIGIGFRSRDSGLAAQIANSYAASFKASNVQRKFAATDDSRNYLRSQLDTAKDRLEASERDLIAYSREARLIDASAGVSQQLTDSPRSLTVSNLVKLNADYAFARSNRVSAEEHWRAVRGLPLMSLQEVMANPAIQQLLQRKAELTAELTQLRKRLQPDHPNVVQATAQIDELTAQVGTLANGIRRSIESQYQIAQRQESALAGQVNTLTGSSLSEQDREVRYNILKREVDTNRQLYESFLQRFKELSAQAGVAANNVTLVDTAEVPRRPISPRPKINLAMALVAGLLVALGFVFARERIDDAIRDPRDLEEKLGLSLLSVVPTVRDATVEQALSDNRSPVSEAYHAARSATELASPRGLYRSILITSSRKAEGKSTTCYSLGRDFASVGRRTLIIDADLRKPSLHGLFGVSKGDVGLSSVLARQVTPAEAVRPTAFAHLTFMPSGPLPPDPAQLIGGESLAAMLEALRASYDVILIDGPPVLALADATQLAAHAEATIFVVESGSAHFGQAKNAVRRLRQAHGNLIGGIVTKYDARSAGYGSDADYYSYNYYREKD